VCGTIRSMLCFRFVALIGAGESIAMENTTSTDHVPSELRALVVEPAGGELSEAVRRARPDDALRVDLVESLSGALTRLRQRTSTGLGYAAILASAEFIDGEIETFERLLVANDQEGLVVLLGEPPEQFDADRDEVHRIESGAAGSVLEERLRILLGTVRHRGEAAALREQLRELQSVNDDLRNRLGLAEKRVQHLNRVFHHARDPVTGVADREFLVESLEIELTHQQRIVPYEFAFCVLEIDEFDHYLERLGRETLDKALVQMTSRLLDTLRTSDRVGRLNQQQFGLIYGDSPTTSDVRAATDRLLETLSSPFEVEGHQLEMSFSIGITVSGPHHETPNDIIQDANLAVAESRTERGTAHTVYDHDYSGDGVEDTALARQMARELQAEDESGFRLEYQPIYRLPEREISGFEALCRWNHPERGAIEPNTFIAIAEHTDLIRDLGLWTLEEAGRKLEEWSDYDEIDELPFLTINLSREQLQSEEFAGEVIDVLKSFDIDLSHLIVELRETATIEHHDAAVTNLGQLKSFGIGIAVDDFGVAHSSFASLYRLPIDFLKIDRSLIAQLSDGGEPGYQIVRHLLELCEEMGLTAIAEGVETEVEHDAIVELGCLFAQGYEYTGALPSEAADRRVLRTPDEVDTDSLYIEE